MKRKAGNKKTTPPVLTPDLEVHDDGTMLIATTYPEGFDYIRDVTPDLGGEFGVRFGCLPGQFISEVK